MSNMLFYQKIIIKYNHFVTRELRVDSLYDLVQRKINLVISLCNLSFLPWPVISLPLYKHTQQTTVWNIVSYYLFFSQKICIDISCRFSRNLYEMSKLDTICMKCQSLFSGKKKIRKYVSKYLLLKISPDRELHSLLKKYNINIFICSWKHYIVYTC